MRPWIFVTLTGIVLCAMVLVPFLIWGDSIEAWVAAQMARPFGPLTLAAFVVALLSADIVLPLPSSLVAVGAGAQLGLILGAVSIFVGLTIGNIVGYTLGRRYGIDFARRMTGGKAQLPNSVGVAMLCLTRPVPVLSEPATVIAGAGSMPISKFLVAIALSNFGIAIVYASLGAYASDVGSFLLVFAAAVTVPALGYGLYWVGTRYRFV